MGGTFPHPDNKYFGVGKIGQDQVKAIADSRGETIEITTKYLRPNLD